MDKRTMWGLVVLGACTAGGAADDMAGELMSDAGRMLVDAGNAMGSVGDGAAGGADAQLPLPAPREPMTLKCDLEKRQKRTYRDTEGEVVLIQEQTHYYALTTGDDIERIQVVNCGFESLAVPPSPDPPVTCVSSENVTCEGDPSLQLPQAECSQGYVDILDGNMRLYCGSKVYQWSKSSEGVVTETTSGSRWNQVKVIFL
jgi:hypothetical protein